MLFKKRVEYNFKFLESSLLRDMYLCKYNSIFPKLFIKKIELFFLFRNIVEVDKLFLHRNLLLLWLCFGKVGVIVNYKNVLRLGVRYQSFRVNINVPNCDGYDIIMFITEKFLPFLSKTAIFHNYNSLLVRVSDLNVFTGIKLAPGVFFVRVLQPLYISIIFFDRSSMKFFYKFLKFNYYELS